MSTFPDERGSFAPDPTHPHAHSLSLSRFFSSRTALTNPVPSPPPIYFGPLRPPPARLGPERAVQCMKTRSSKNKRLCGYMASLSTAPHVICTMQAARKRISASHRSGGTPKELPASDHYSTSSHSDSNSSRRPRQNTASPRIPTMGRKHLHAKPRGVWWNHRTARRILRRDRSATAL